MTPKPLKALMLAGVLLLMFGVAARAGTGDIWGTAIAVLGALLYAAGKVAAWWRSG